MLRPWLGKEVGDSEAARVLRDGYESFVIGELVGGDEGEFCFFPGERVSAGGLLTCFAALQQGGAGPKRPFSSLVRGQVGTAAGDRSKRPWQG